MRHPVLAHAAANIQPGVDVAHRFGEEGTLGLLVRMGTGSAVLAASCSHVLAREGLASEGDFVEHPILLASGGGEQNEFGRLTSTFTLLNQTDTFDEDFALAAIDVPHIASCLPTEQSSIALPIRAPDSLQEPRPRSRDLRVQTFPEKSSIRNGMELSKCPLLAVCNSKISSPILREESPVTREQPFCRREHRPCSAFISVALTRLGSSCHCGRFFSGWTLAW
jgi:hypothetical protein